VHAARPPKAVVGVIIVLNPEGNAVVRAARKFGCRPTST
jgi:hypothetical protein